MIWIGIEFSDHQDTYDGSTHDLTMVMSVADQMLTGGFSNQGLWQIFERDCPCLEIPEPVLFMIGAKTCQHLARSNKTK